MASAGPAPAGSDPDRPQPAGEVTGHEPVPGPAAARTPAFRNPAAEPDSTPGKQSELKLNVGIGILGTALSIFSALIFFLVMDRFTEGVVFAVIALGAAVLTGWFAQRLVKGRRAGREQGSASEETAAA